MRITEIVEDQLRHEEPDMPDYRKEKVMQGAEIAEALEKAANAMATEKYIAKGLALGLLRLHPTLQSSVVTTIIIAMGEYAEGLHYTDLRNEAAKEAAEQIGEINDGYPLPTA